MAAKPEVRVALYHAYFKAIDELPPTDRDAVLAGFKPGFRESLEERLSSTFVSGRVNEIMVIALINGIGVDGMFRMFRSMYARHVYRGPVFQDYMDRIAEITGHKSPTDYFRWTVRWFPAVFRNHGTWKISDIKKDRLKLELCDYPDLCIAADHLFMRMTEHSLHPVFELADTVGEIHYLSADDDARVASFEAIWR